MATPLSVSPPGILHKKPFVSRQFATGNEVTIRYNPGSVNWLASASAVNVRRGIRALAFYLLIIHMVLGSPDNGILFNLRPSVVAISWYSSPLSSKDEQFHMSYWLAVGSLAFNLR